MRHLLVLVAFIAIVGCEQRQVSKPLLPPPPAQQPVGVPTREIAEIEEMGSASFYQPGQPLTISVELDVADNPAANTEIDDVFLTAEFAKLNFVMVNKAKFDLQLDSTELVDIYPVDDVAFENTTDMNKGVEITFQIPFDINSSGTYWLASFADTPDKPVTESQYADTASRDASPITVKTVNIEVDATQHYHDFELNEINVDEAAFVVDLNALEDLDISAAFSSTYWGVSGYVPVDESEGIKVGEPRRGAVKIEVMIGGIWESLTFAKTEPEINTLPDDQLEIEYPQPGKQLGYSATGTLPLTLLTQIIDDATGGVDVTTLDPLVAVAQVPLRVSLIDPLAESENISDNNFLELSLPLHVMQGEADPLATASPSNALMKSNALRMPSLPAIAGPGVCPPRGIAATRQFAKSFGARKTFWASASQGVKNSDTAADRSTAIWSTSSAALFNSRTQEIHHFQLKAKIEDSGNTASGSFRLFGKTIWSKTNGSDSQFSLSLPKTDTAKEIVKKRFTVGPVPILVTIRVVSKVSGSGSVTLDDSLTVSLQAPKVTQSLVAFGGVNILRWTVGPTIAGILQELSMLTEYTLDLRDTDEDGFCDTTTSVSLVAKALAIKAGLAVREEAPKRVKWCKKWLWPGFYLPYPCGLKSVGKAKYTNFWIWKSGFVFNKAWPIWTVGLDRTAISEILEIEASLQAGFGPQPINVTGTSLAKNMKLTTAACQSVSGGTGDGSSRLFWCNDPVAAGPRPIQYPVTVTSGKTFTGFNLIVTPAPIITGVTPLEIFVGQETTFTVSGNHLTDEIAFELEGEGCEFPVLMSDGMGNTANFSCTPATSGVLDATVTNGTTTQSFSITVIGVPEITKVAPGVGVVGIPKTFTISGSWLTSSLSVALPGCDNVTLDTSTSMTSRSFTCTPNAPGTLSGTVTDGAALHDFNVEVAGQPDITTVTPGVGVVGILETFTISGSWLTSSLSVDLPDCDNVTLDASTSTTDRSFTCTPNAQGTLSGTVTDGATIHDFSLEVDGQPVITAVTPGVGVVGILETFTISGFWLTSNLSVVLPGCDNVILDTSTSKTDRSFTCTPNTPGTKSGTVNDGVTTYDFDVEVDGQPVITAVAPGVGIAGVAQTFSISGFWLTSNLSVALPGCDNVTLDTSTSTTDRSFTCTPNAQGTLSGTVTDGATLYDFDVDIVALNQPAIIDLQPAFFYHFGGEFIVTGSNLTDAMLLMGPPGCENLTPEPGGTSEVRRFICFYPTVADEFDGYNYTVTVQDGSSSTTFDHDVRSYTINRLNRGLYIAGEQQGQNQITLPVSVPSEIVVGGDGLTSRIRFVGPPGCESLTPEPNGTPIERRFICTPTQAGSFTITVQDGPATLVGAYAEWADQPIVVQVEVVGAPQQ